MDIKKYAPIGLLGIGIVILYMVFSRSQQSEPVQYSQPAPNPATIGPLPQPERTAEIQAQLSRAAIASQQFSNLINYDLELRKLNFYQQYYLGRPQQSNSNQLYAMSSSLSGILPFVS